MRLRAQFPLHPRQPLAKAATVAPTTPAYFTSNSAVREVETFDCSDAIEVHETPLPGVPGGGKCSRQPGSSQPQPSAQSKKSAPSQIQTIQSVQKIRIQSHQTDEKQGRQEICSQAM